MGRKPRSAAAAAAAALALFATAAVPLAAGASASDSGHPTPPAISATLTQCVTSVVQEERSATFAGEMGTIRGAARMAMRIELEERRPHAARFHVVAAPGAGAWRTSEPHVKVFKYLDQVTDLSAPARFRAAVRFRWLNARGATIRRASRLTKVCEQPAVPPAPTSTTPAA